MCLGVHPLWEELVSMWLNTTLQFCVYSQQLCFWMSEFLKPCLIDKQKFPQDELTCRVCVCPRFCIGITDFPSMQVLNSSWWLQLCSRAFATSEVEYLKNDHQLVDLGVLFLFKTCKICFIHVKKCIYGCVCLWRHPLASRVLFLPPSCVRGCFLRCGYYKYLLLENFSTLAFLLCVSFSLNALIRSICYYSHKLKSLCHFFR